MSSTVIKIENLSKQYKLGEISTGAISHDINRWWHRIRGKEDPYLRVGEENDRSKKGYSQYVWALQDVNFEVKQGEVLGIIGRNGAGKSTLLKLLSKVTKPTTGQIKVKGRIASLLEVGTGFHPELSGRENIYLNGAILGMTKKEVKSKFDEIVDFAGVERYIDTPVKRYSSGMYVRLAFAVAAHLEPEILIVDEVLAVGDAEFQKKCLGKMKEVSTNDGRAVLFVSHQMGTIAQLCDRSIMLKRGTLLADGKTSEVIQHYLNNDKDASNIYLAGETSKQKGVYLEEVRIFNRERQELKEFLFTESICVRSRLRIDRPVHNLKISITLQDVYGYYISTSVFEFDNAQTQNKHSMDIQLTLPPAIIAPNNYFFRVALFSESEIFEVIENICGVKVIDNGTPLSKYEGINYGSVILNTEWDIA